MKPKSSPHDPISVAVLVMHAIEDINSSSDEQRGTLLSALLCAAWGSPSAQRQ